MDGQRWHEREQRDEAHRRYHERPHPAWITAWGAVVPAKRA